MLVELKKLKPNPLRDFTVDPIDDDERLQDLKRSIKEDGFWGGVVCRRKGDDIEIAAGHRRVKVALACGIREADVFVADDFDDAAMVRVYARENATQRGNTSTALAGSVAAALRISSKMILSGSVSREFARNHDLDKIKGNLTSDKGIGEPVIGWFLRDVPGVNEHTVRQSMASLKASGDYARIIHEVKKEIERENKEALKALAKAEKEQKAAAERAAQAEQERKEAAARAKEAREEAARAKAETERQRTEAEAKLAAQRQQEADEELKKFDKLRQTRDDATKAAAASNGKPITFDFEGAAKHLKNAHQIDVFRQAVTGKNIASILPVEHQEKLAKHIVQLAKNRAAELTGSFIRENITTLVIKARMTQRNLSEEEEERLKNTDLDMRADSLQQDFARSCRSMFSYGKKITELLEEWPKDKVFRISNEFRRAIRDAKKSLDNLNERISQL